MGARRKHAYQRIAQFVAHLGATKGCDTSHERFQRKKIDICHSLPRGQREPARSWYSKLYVWSLQRMLQSTLVRPRSWPIPTRQSLKSTYAVCHPKLQMLRTHCQD